MGKMGKKQAFFVFFIELNILRKWEKTGDMKENKEKTVRLSVMRDVAVAQDPVSAV